VTASVVLFGLIVQDAGLAIATMVLVLVSAFASPDFRPLASFLLALALAVFCVLVFVTGLGCRFRCWARGGEAKAAMEHPRQPRHRVRTALLPLNLFYCFLGVLLGTLVGVLPGWGRSRTSPCCCPQPTCCPQSGAHHAVRHLLRRPSTAARPRRS